MTRDVSRRQVYVAEDASLAGTGCDLAPGEDVLVNALDALFACTWWQRIVGVRPTVTFATNRGTGFYRHDENRIHLGRDARWIVAIHELAHLADACWHHAAAERSAHDERFRGWELTVVEATVGDDFAGLLAAGFADLGLAVRLPSLDVAPPRPAVWRQHVSTPQLGGWCPPPGSGAVRAYSRVP